MVHSRFIHRWPNYLIMRDDVHQAAQRLVKREFSAF